MWLFSKYGYYSAACARTGDGQHGQLVDQTKIMVRARLRSHLTALKERFPDLLGQSEIRVSPFTDYAYRIFVEKPIWSQVLVGLNEEIDYDNFKSEVARHQGRSRADYEGALHEVWVIMNDLQK